MHQPFFLEIRACMAWSSLGIFLAEYPQRILPALPHEVAHFFMFLGVAPVEGAAVLVKAGLAA
jgi:hypothetical protein